MRKAPDGYAEDIPAALVADQQPWEEEGCDEKDGDHA